MSRMSDGLLWVCLPLFNTLNQVAMKLTAGVVRHEAFGLQWFMEAALRPFIWMSFACEIISFAVWLAILKRHHLSHAFPLTAVSYATLMLVSWLYFHEPLVLRQIIGVAIIVAGIVLIGFKSKNFPSES